MRTELTTITPALARQWLTLNRINRTLRPGVVENWLRVFQRGEYRVTHQGIAFDANGDLADGQHRLSAIERMPDDFAVDMLVTWELEPASFDGIDQGLRRTPADVLGIAAGLASVARILANIHDTSRTGITPQLIRPFADGIAGEYYRLVEYCPASTRTWGSGPIRTAACLQMATGIDRDYVLMSYYALNHQEYDSMRPIVQTLNRQRESRGKDSRTQTYGWSLFCRAFKAFESANQAMESLVVGDTSVILAKARTIIEQRVLKTQPVRAIRRIPAAKKQDKVSE